MTRTGAGFDTALFFPIFLNDDYETQQKKTNIRKARGNSGFSHFSSARLVHGKGTNSHDGGRRNRRQREAHDDDAHGEKRRRGNTAVRIQRGEHQRANKKRRRIHLARGRHRQIGEKIRREVRVRHPRRRRIQDDKGDSRARDREGNARGSGRGKAEGLDLREKRRRPRIFRNERRRCQGGGMFRRRAVARIRLERKHPASCVRAGRRT